MKIGKFYVSVGQIIVAVLVIGVVIALVVIT